MFCGLGVWKDREVVSLDFKMCTVHSCDSVQVVHETVRGTFAASLPFAEDKGVSTNSPAFGKGLKKKRKAEIYGSI